MHRREFLNRVAAAAASALPTDITPTFLPTRLTLDSAPEMRCGDQITTVHECTHGVNSRLRQAHGGTGRVNCFFVLDGLFFRAQEPRPITLADVASKVRLRGDTFNTYMVEQCRWWNDEPLYTFDEWTAYVNGTVIAWQRNVTDHASTLWFALEHAHYCATLIDMLPETYQDLAELTMFWLWQAARLDTIAGASKDTGRLYRPSNDTWRNEMHRAYGRFRETVAPPWWHLLERWAHQ